MRLAWSVEERSFVAVEPTPEMLEQHAGRLLAWYNARENAAMMTGSGTMSRPDVVDFWRELRAAGGRGFLSFADGELVGDMDLRAVRDGGADFAIMIGETANKGRGFGKTLARMIHVFAFRELGLERLFVSPRRDNARVLGLEAYLGYTRDDGAQARERADTDPDCDTYSLGGDEFRRRHEDAWREVAVG